MCNWTSVNSKWDPLMDHTIYTIYVFTHVAMYFIWMGLPAAEHLPCNFLSFNQTNAVHAVKPFIAIKAYIWRKQCIIYNGLSSLSRWARWRPIPHAVFEVVVSSTITPILGSRANQTAVSHMRTRAHTHQHRHRWQEQLSSCIEFH